MLATTVSVPAQTPLRAARPALAAAAITEGAEALAALGPRLPAVAAAHRVSAEHFRELIRRDAASVRLDGNARLFYACAPVAVNTATLEPTPGDGPQFLNPSSQTYAPQEAFLLHSRPGASKVIFLDFDGHLLSGNAWAIGYNGGQDILAPPFDFDGVPGTFNDAERNRIIGIWKRVAEDYIPFDVDVTTEDPGEAAMNRAEEGDTAYGVRVLISPMSSYIGNYGGLSYFNTFDMMGTLGDFYKPCLVFPENLGNYHEKYIAEACAHEAGHSLALSHDGTTTGLEYYGGHGTGTNGWAPIMGSSYSKSVTQWSKGEYLNANNLEDDLATIASHIPYAADDHGDSFAAATVLAPGAPLAASGTLGFTGDVDVFRFDAGQGAAVLTVKTAPLNPDADLQLELYDSGGSLMACTNPPAQLYATLSRTLTAGTYFLAVRSAGYNAPTNGYSVYASLGQYELTLAVVDPTVGVPPVAVATATPQMGVAPLSVSFSSAQSGDPDGTLQAWNWTFGDGTTSTEANPVHLYQSAGTYLATLTVTDNTGLTNGASVTITVAPPNQLPVASIIATPSSGAAPLVVTFNGSGSTDPDGTIASYAWNFGDGGTASGATAQHTYSATGTFTATLTVTDNQGATATSSVGINVTPNQSTVMRVQSITLVVNGRSSKTVTATVRLTTPGGVAVTGATVTGGWSGKVTGSGSAVTDASGYARLTSKSFSSSGTVTFTVTGAAKSGWTYDPTLNAVTAAAIAAAQLPQPPAGNTAPSVTLSASE